MSSRHQLLGLYLPTGSWVHRCPALAKIGVVTGSTLVAVLLRSLVASLGLLALAVVVLLCSRVPWRRAFAISPAFWVMVALVMVYPAVFGDPVDAAVTGVTMVASLLMARTITLTTPAMALVDATVWLCRPLDWVGIGAERAGLAVMVMLRAVPYLFDSLERVQQAARARGLERHLLARLSPVVVDAVAYAIATGEALEARGLGDDPAPDARVESGP